MCFINKLDRTGANFFMCVDMISERLGSYPLVTQLPIGIESNLKGVVDLVTNKAIIWQDESLGAKFDIVEIPEDLREKSAEYREKLIEKAIEEDDSIMESYLEGKEPSTEEIKKCIRRYYNRFFRSSSYRFCIQKQGCSAFIRCCYRLYAITKRCSQCQRSRYKR